MAKKPVFQVTGTKQTSRNLLALAAKTQTKIAKQAVAKAATPVVKAARKIAPLGDGKNPDGTQRPHLRKTMTKTAAKLYKKSGSIVCTVGPKARAAPHAFLVDLGTKPHDITLTKPWGRVPAGTVIKHPGAKASHFMLAAANQTRAQSQSIMKTSLVKGIEKEAAKLGSRK